MINKSALEKSEAQRKYDEWLADRPTVGSDEWKKKHANAGDTMLVEEDGGISMVVYDGKEWRTVSEPKSQCDFDRELGFSCVRPTNHSGPCTPHTDAIPTTQAVALDAPSTEDFEKLKTMVMERFDELEKQERDAEKLEKRKAYGEKVDASKKYKRDIDKLFRDYHDRNKRREELNQRIAEELGKGKPPKRSWKRFALLSGSLTAIVSSAYILYPYVNGLIQASF